MATKSKVKGRKGKIGKKKAWIAAYYNSGRNMKNKARRLREAIATQRREKEKQPGWFKGVSYGSVVGALRQVADIEGEHLFVIVPPVGAARVECTFPESQREKMSEYLWKTVRVNGRLTYDEGSPFPTHVDMDTIERASPSDAPHLLELRGLFKGLDRDDFDLERMLDGV